MNRFIRALSVVLFCVLGLAESHAAPTAVTFGADRTVSPWNICVYDQNNVCQSFMKLPAINGGAFIPLVNMNALTANSIYANVSGSTASPSIVTMPSCGSTGQALNYTSGTGFGCVSGNGNVVGPGSSTIGHLPSFGNTVGTLLNDSGIIAANVALGAASSTNGNLASYSGTGGKQLADSGIGASNVATLSGAQTVTGSKTFTPAQIFSAPPIFTTLMGYLKGNGASALTASSTVPTTDLSGTLQAAQAPALTGDVTSTAGSLATAFDLTKTHSWTGAQTFATANVNGGAINGTTVGATTASTGAFTTLGASGLITSTFSSTSAPAIQFASAFSSTGGTVNKLGLFGVGYGFGVTDSATAHNSLDYVAIGNHSYYIGSTYVGGVTSTGLNSMAVGQTTPKAGSFTTLSASSAPVFSSLSNGCLQAASGIVTSTGSACGAGGGGVTSVGGSFTGGLVSVAGSPVTASGTLAFSVAGTSGGIPYFSSGSTWASSAAGVATDLMAWGGAGAAPTDTGIATANVATLNTQDQVITGGFLYSPPFLGSFSSGTFTPDCGKGPVQWLGSSGTFTVAAPTADGSCIIQFRGSGNGGTVTLSGYGTSPSGTGDTFTTAVSRNTTCTFTIASPGVVNLTAHGYQPGNQVYFFNTGGALPTGITAFSTYYVIPAGLTANAFEISSTPNGTAINLSGTQSGTQSCVTPSVFLLNISTVRGLSTAVWKQQQ